ncbi:TPA: hypothetical protein QB621_000964 [Pasteurella multocida]|uniref:hypothetical protein n=1 Tax=Pasteurella multocida TaxID=747 RepID=UPI002CE55191|nr:hypothetical protein [Pasteurella multocida]MEB3477346.1 hypothetical protein [Pasteurella multocida]MEB3493485.1 hypothetical protein [Pasteurella multocida]HDR1130495.1 hypothetical protein [Pasteurella multocida]HDR1816329.1 hypothetical protein [Pasteurella multocida]
MLNPVLNSLMKIINTSAWRIVFFISLIPIGMVVYSLFTDQLLILFIGGSFIFLWVIVALGIYLFGPKGKRKEILYKAFFKNEY